MKLDHLIYGTFPDLPGSQQVVFKTPGIDVDLEQWLLELYNEFGDCKNEDFVSSLTVRWFRAGETPLCALTKVSQFGKDFSGRWGALLRHTAILTPDQFVELRGNLRAVAEQLVSSGTSAELSQEREVEVPLVQAEPDLSPCLAELQENDYLTPLRRLLSGDRLVAFGDKNSGYTNRFLANLISLLPLSWRAHFDWSEFTFRPLEDLDLAICYNSRYELPGTGPIDFQTAGANHFAAAGIEPDGVAGFLTELETALAAGDAEALGRIVAP